MLQLSHALPCTERELSALGTPFLYLMRLRLYTKYVNKQNVSS